MRRAAQCQRRHPSAGPPPSSRLMRQPAPPPPSHRRNPSSHHHTVIPAQAGIYLALSGPAPAQPQFCQIPDRWYYEHKLVIWVIIGLSLSGRYSYGQPSRLSPRCPLPRMWLQLDAQRRHLPRPPSLSLRRLRTPHHPRCGTANLMRFSLFRKSAQVDNTPDAAYQRPSAADRERALAMYQEGSSPSAIARIFEVSVQAVSQWVKKGARRAVPDAPAGRKAHWGRSGRPAGGGDCV